MLLLAVPIPVLFFGLVAGCSQVTGGTGPSVTEAGPLRRYATIEELSAAVRRRLAEDRTVRVGFRTMVTQGNTVQQERTGESQVRVDSIGTAARTSLTTRT